MFTDVEITDPRRDRPFDILSLYCIKIPSLYGLDLKYKSTDPV